MHQEGEGPELKVAVPKIDIPDVWADNEVRASIDAKLVPLEMQSGYKNNITRKDFCSLVIHMIEVKADKSIDLIVTEKGLDLNNNPFTDTTDKAIITANKLGIVNGTGDGKFSPAGEITRQEAAVMLANTAKSLGVDLKAEVSSFSDREIIADWAKTQTDFVFSKDIMKGNGTIFDPTVNIQDSKLI